MYAIKVAQSLVTSRHYRQEVCARRRDTSVCSCHANIHECSCRKHAEQTLSSQAVLPHIQVLRVLVNMLLQSKEVDYVLVCQCLMFLNEPTEVASVLENLISGSEVCFSKALAVSVLRTTQEKVVGGNFPCLKSASPALSRTRPCSRTRWRLTSLTMTSRASS